jgi:acyl-CoA thioesterase 8
MARQSFSSTVKPPPPNDPELSAIENNIALSPLSEVGPNIFTNTRTQWQPVGARGIFGGSVIAQSLLAAQLTVPAGFVVHSLHSYFMLAGNNHIPLIYHVDIVREGRSFHTRTVQARQRGKAIFTMIASFTVPLSVKYQSNAAAGGEEGWRTEVVAHQPTMPERVMPPEECEAELQVIDRLLKSGRINEESAKLGRKRYERDPFEWRTPSGGGVVLRESGEPATPTDPPAMKATWQWVRSKTPIRDPIYHNPALAYVSDSWFIGNIGKVSPQVQKEKIGMMVSLDHTMHFHCGERAPVDDWVLFEREGPWAGEERSLMKMRVWNRYGELLATCSQEGMVRLKDGREGEDTTSATLVSKL